MDTKRKKQNRKPSRNISKLAASIIIITLLAFSAGVLTDRVFYTPQNIIIIRNTTTTSSSLINSNQAEAVVLAIRGDNNMGILGHVIVQIQPGQGRVLVNTNPFVETDTQDSAATAVAIASQFTNKSLVSSDVIVSFSANATLVGGPSAGGATTVAAIAAMSGRSVRQDVAMTGTINSDGSIGQVGGVFEKVQAAAETGMREVLIPQGQVTQVYYQQEIQNMTSVGGLTVQRTIYVPKEINLTDFALQQWNVSVVEVSNIQEAVGYLLN
jgi:uncharacterized protein